MYKEIKIIEKNDTWEWVDLPPKIKVIEVKWVSKVKFKPDGNIQKFKPRLVMKGYRQ